MDSTRFRLWSGRIVAKLLARFGPSHLTLIEDAVQDAFLKALKSWPAHGEPQNPQAWLHRVATNHVLDDLKRPPTTPLPEETPIQEDSLDPDDLALIGLCCHPSLTPESQIALTLREAFGLSSEEIARALQAQTTAIQQRIVRAKRTLTDLNPSLQPPDPETVLRIVYLIFNEGFVATSGPDLARPDLCAEALRLHQRFLNTSPSPPTHALMALMLFHSSRLPARIGPSGELCLLREQNRSLWDKDMIAVAFHHLGESAAGNTLTTYHAEAAIASVHAAAPTYDQTDWPQLLRHYDDLTRISPSPIVLLNRAVVLAELHGPETGLQQLDAIPASQLQDSYLLSATRGDFLLRLNRPAEAIKLFQQALDRTKNEAERKFLQGRIQSASTKPDKVRPIP